jgi:hypothetical protein
MEEAPENGKELSHSAHANGINKMGTAINGSNVCNETLHQLLNILISCFLIFYS